MSGAEGPGGREMRNTSHPLESTGPALGLIFHSVILEKGISTHFSTLAWRIPWTEETGGLQSMGSQTIRHD